ncbi:cytosine permease [Streptomyces sp. NPDC088252]|uniref:cytosine permease n=1 Tax=Streptomyces sp. NPDC088252 TaxID=3365845 RepID=UPI003803BD71
MNAGISLSLGTPLMMTAAGFTNSFVSFPTLLAATFPAWIGVFGVDRPRGRRYDPAALLDTTPPGAYWYTGASPSRP